MALVIPAASEVLLLSFMVGKAAPATTWTLRLFVNDHTPSEADQLDASDYTEMTTQNYAPITLTNSAWTVSPEDPEALAVQPEKTFTFDGSGGDTPVYGYYITDDTADELVLAERFPITPTVPDTLGGTIDITPQIDLRNLGEV